MCELSQESFLTAIFVSAFGGLFIGWLGAYVAR